jgi:molybdopterin-synthase adenylyltransferase
LLTPNERKRYDRQIMIMGFGEEGQLRLKKARVVICGTGGLGSAVAIYLAAAGIGTIRLIDHDLVESSNLNRQILHWERDIGREKVISAAEKLRQFNSCLEVEAVYEMITESSASRLVDGFDLIVDAMDNLTTRYLLNHIALNLNLPFFHGAIHGFEGRVMTVIPGKSACLGCVYRGNVPKGKFPAIGVTPAVVGCIQATEVIKYIVGIGRLLTDRLLVYDGLNMNFTELKVKRDPNCKFCCNTGEK